MLNRLFGQETHNYLHLIGLSGLAFGLPLNKVVMSISMMFLLLNLLLEANFKTYWHRIKNSRLFILIAAFFLLHVIGLAWSENISYGLHDLRVKLPLIVVPLVLIAKPVKIERHKIILGSFLLSLLITSVFNYLSYQQLLGEYQYDDIRGMSLFASHIRYGLLIAMGAAVSISFLRTRSLRIIGLILLIWFVYYTFVSQVLSGMLALTGVMVVYLLFVLWNIRKWLMWGALSLGTILVFALLIDLLTPIDPSSINLNELDKYTAEGNPYRHESGGVSPETGKPIGIYICEEELRREWNKVSAIPYDGIDVKGHPIRWTLIRYLSSMDVRKDSKGFQQLSEKDIKCIEHGCASKYSSGLMARYYGIKYQLNNNSDPNNHSLLMRIEYWKSAIQIAQNNFILGVGTGDVQDSFDQNYENQNSILKPENRCRAHNYYLTVLLTFGVVGLFLFFWIHSEFMLLNLSKKNMLAIAFMTIILLSYLIEDTLETQTGVTFFGLFIGMFGSKELS